MDVVSICPLRVGSIVWQPRPGAWTLTLVVKATFLLAPGEARLADLQEDPARSDRHFGGEEARSLYAASDLAPLKPRADVLLVGSAFAPQRRPARAVATRLDVGEVDKRVEVWCDRVFWQDSRLLEGQPFAQMPLVYERAAGGPGTSNPAGMRFDAAPDAYGSVPIPNLQPAGLHVTRRGETFAPIAYGPIAPTWSGRVNKLHRHAAGWSHGGWSAQPLPTDIDPAYFNSAPHDQQLESIRPDQRILLENLHPEHPLLETRLPGLQPRAHMSTGGPLGELIELVGDTLWIDTDRGVATVVWRGRVALSHAREEGRIVVSMQAAGAAPRAQGYSVAPSHTADDPTLLGDLGGEDSGTLQLAPGEVETILGGRAAAVALPFQAGKSPWIGVSRAAATPPAPSLPEDTGTVFGARSPQGELLPFAAGIAPLKMEPEPEPERIGPLARVEMGAQPPDHSTSAKASESATGTAPDEEPPPEPKLAIEEYPIERCGAITASIARRRAETAQILEENQLDAPGWAALEEHWNEAISKETGRGKTALLHAFDAAYVAQLEKERGPIELEEYARLLIAAERGSAREMLASLTLPRGAMMRIERVWLTKIAEDDGLGKSVRSAVKAAREE